MVDDRIQLSRRKILAGLGAVGAAGAGAGLGTSALFSDTEGFEGNTLAAGELDLKIDWQQTYDGPPDDDFPAYADAGYPWVNAHPDEGEADDPNGIQSIDSDQYASVADDGVVTYEDANANIQEYLTCETLDQEYDFGEGQDHLVELGDVKPGDSGEVTFSFHLCDNPGYVWFCGALNEATENGTTEPEAASDEEGEGVELLDAIHVQTWYDVDCDNEFEPGEGENVLLDTPTTLRTFFESRLQNDCYMLDPAFYPGIAADDPACEPAGRIEFAENGLSVADSEDEVIKYETGDSTDDGPDGDNLEYYFLLRNQPNDVDIVLRLYNMVDGTGDFVNDPSADDLSDIVELDFEIIPEDQTITDDDGNTYRSDDRAFCEVTFKAFDSEPITADLVTTGACEEGLEGFTTPNGAADGFEYLDWSYCAPGSASPMCFPSEQTFCLGFEWWVPASVGNEIQSDSVSFDLGFYTEQCRNNDGSGPVDFSG